MIKEKNKRKTIIVWVGIFSLVYIFFALRPLGTELHLSPEWTVDTSRVTEPRTGDEPIPFRLGQSIGYFTQDGRVISRTSFAFKASISDSYYTTYTPDSKEFTVYNNMGAEHVRINEYGFPFFDQDRIFVMLPGGSSFIQCKDDGSRKWLYESYAPLTALSTCKNGTVAGFSDGTIVSFTPDGIVDQRFKPEGSKIPIILGVALSSDGNLIASVSGQNQQRFVIAQKNGEHTKFIFHEYMEKDFNRQVLVQFSRNDDMVFYNYNGGLGIVDLKKLKAHHVKFDGLITQIQESENNNLIYVLGKNGDKYTVMLVEPFDHPAATFSFTADSAFIQVKGDALFVGRDDKISRLTISRN